MNILQIERTSFADSGSALPAASPPVTEIPDTPPVSSVSVWAVAQVVNSKVTLITVRLSDVLDATLRVTVSLVSHNESDGQTYTDVFGIDVTAGHTVYSYNFHNPLRNGGAPLFSSVVATITTAYPNPCGGSDIVLDGGS